MSNGKDAEFAYIETQIKLSSEQLDKLDLQEQKLLESIQTIKDISAKPEHNAKVPIVDGVYVNAKITQTDQFLVDVGADTVVPKTALEAITLLEGQLQKTQEYQEKVSQRLLKLSKQADEINTGGAN